MTGDFDLTPEELEAKATEIRQRRLKRKSVWHKEWRKDQLATNADAFRATKAKQEKKRRDKNPAKIVASVSATRNKSRSNKTYFCKPCNLACRTKYDLENHKKSPRHLQKTGEIDPLANLKPYQARAVANKLHYCKDCDLACKTSYELTTHKKTKRHLSKVAHAQIGGAD